MENNLKKRNLIIGITLVSIPIGLMVFVAILQAFFMPGYSNNEAANPKDDQNETQREIDKLKQEVEAFKNQKPQVIVKENIQQVPNPQLAITATDLTPYLTSVVRIECGDSTGSGIFIKIEQANLNNSYYILTNKHVIDIENATYNPSDGTSSCLVFFENINNGIESMLKIAINDYRNWNKMTDIALITIDESMAVNKELFYKELKGLNSSLFLLRSCPTNISIGSPVFLIGYPASGAKNVSVNGYTGPMKFRITTGGTISGYDSSTNIKGLPYSDYFVSAKIDGGNSGGAAVSKDKNGLCFLGIPTWLTIGNYETQGLVQNIQNILYAPR